MACGCGSGGAGGSASKYEVKVNGRVVYTSTSETAARSVAARYGEADIVGPDGTTLPK